MRLKKSLLFLICFLLFALINADDYRLLKPHRAEILTEDKVTLVGSYYPVKTVNSPAVILVHMLGRNRGDWNEYARFLQKEGISVLSIDLRGHGESTNAKTLNWRDFSSPEYLHMISDLKAVYQYLIGLGADPKKIGLVGMNLGANLVLNFAAQQEEVASVVLISPSLDDKGVKTDQAIIKYEGRPLYIICEKSDTASCAAAEDFKQTAKSKFKLDIYDNQGIGGIYLFFRKINLYKNVSTWFQQTLF